MAFIRLVLMIAISIQGPFALAKKRAPKAYSFITVGGKASQYECDGDGKIPRKLQRQKEVSKSGSYLGSEVIELEPKSKANEEMWKHFFRDKPSCNAVLSKAPSAKGEPQAEKKADLPPDEPSDLEDETEGNEPTSGSEPETEP